MLRRADPRWGWSGLVRLNGYGQMHGPGSASDGFLHSDDLFGTLMRIFPGRFHDGHEADIRKELDWLRELILKDDRRWRAKQPSRAQINAALDDIARSVRQFLTCAQHVEFDWLAGNPPTEPAGRLSVAYSFPNRLRALVRSARRAGNAELLMVADAADRLAEDLTMLNEPSQSRIFRYLPNTWDYEVRQFADTVRIAQRLELATRTALETGKKSGGPLPRPMLLHVVISLGELVERYGGTFAHNPYRGLEYKGEVNTPAGHFVLQFLQSCLHITEQTVCSLMAAAIKRRNRTRDRKSGIRATSF
ncbi:hypothetical protein ABIB80_006259 [Bradyrhizobium sp. i1.15.2]